MKKIIVFLFVAILSVGYGIAQSVSVQDFTIIHNHFLNGEKGMLFRATFTVHGMRNIPIRAAFAVVDPGSGNVLMTNYGTNMLVFHTLTPNWDDTKWTNLESFISYSVFPSLSGTFNLSGVFQVVAESNLSYVIPRDDGLSRSTVNFTFTGSGQQNIVPVVPVVPNNTVSPQRCLACKGKGTIEAYNYSPISGFKYCPTCGIDRPNGHYHKTCPGCYGSGWIR